MTFQIMGNRYGIGNRLGEGSMGAVYRATDRLTGEPVAIKQVNITTKNLAFASRPATDNADELRLALAREFEILASLRHPHIISVLDYGFGANQQPFFTMTLLNNPQTVIEYGRNLDISQKAERLIQILQALTYLHRRRILHRDIKPANVLITADGDLKVLDFGLSASTEHAKGVAGTLTYMAPEVLRGKDVTPSSDLYAVGMIAYELFVGNYPFDTRNPTRLMSSIANTIPDVSSLKNPPLEAVLSRWLHKNPAERYQTAEQIIQELCGSLNLPAPQESIAIRESFLQSAQFTGRKTELEQLQGAFEQAQGGKGSVWLIGGESGVGKSRLVDELRIFAMTKGVNVLTGGAIETGGVAYHLWRDILPKLLLNTPVDEYEASILKEITPNINHVVGYAVPDAPTIDANPRKLRLQVTFNALFNRQETPTLLILDDLQWADTSLDLLKSLIGIIAELPILIIGTYRDDERPKLPEELGVSNTISLKRFETGDIEALSTAMLGKIGKKADLVNLLNQETEGNVFFLIEVVRALAEDVGNLGQIGTKTLPESVFTGGIQAIVSRRLSKLPAHLQNITQWAAVLGREIDLNLLGHDYDMATIENWLSASADAMVIEIRDNKWRFAHDKLRDGALHGIPTDTRTHLHHQAAVAIESTYPNNQDYHPALLEHWHVAGDLNKEVDYLKQVVERALSTTGVHQKTYFILERALNALPEDDERRTALLNLSGSANFFSGKFDQAAEYSEKAKLLAEKYQDERQIAESLSTLGNVASRKGKFGESEAILRQTISIWEKFDNVLGVARSTSTIGMLNFRQGNYEVAQAHFEKALGIYESKQDKQGIAIALNYLGYVCVAHDEFDKAKGYYDQSLAIFKSIGEQRGISLLLGNIGWVLNVQSKYKEAIDYYQQSLDLARAVGNPHLVTVQLQELGASYSLIGEYETGMSYFEQCLAMRRSMGDKIGIGSVLNQIGLYTSKKGDLAKAEEYLLESISIGKETGEKGVTIDGLCNLGTVYAKQGDSRATACFMEGLKSAREIQTPVGVYSNLLGMGWFFAMNGQPQRAGELIGVIQSTGDISSHLHRDIDELLPVIQLALTPNDLNTCLERGKTLNLDEVANMLLAEFDKSE